jgi:hypothetical protein
MYILTNEGEKYFKEIYLNLIKNQKEAHMKKAVFYLQPTVLKGVDGYVVKGWENVLTRDRLPKEYFKGYPYFYQEFDKVIIIPMEASPFCYTIRVGDAYWFSKQYWNGMYNLMKEAGRRLSKILQKPKMIKVEI